MEYVFSNQNMADVKDQFMLGDKILVAPVVESNATERTVVLPNGKWKADDGKMYKGGRSIVVKTALDRLPYFELVGK
jgi:alpha-glucosidase